jgi:hypothetical protein
MKPLRRVLATLFTSIDLEMVQDGPKAQVSHRTPKITLAEATIALIKRIA